MARHSLPRGRHTRYDLPQSVTRHAAGDDALTATGSIPVRRGIAVVAVVGGALSAVGTTGLGIPQPHDPADPDTAAIALAAQSKHAKQQDDDKRNGKHGKQDDDRDDDPILDSDAVAKTVREANEQGKRLAEKNKSDDDDREAGGNAATSSAAISPGTGDASMPGELIDTNEWYLTLPTGKQGSPDTIDGSKLATYHSKFFALNQQRNGIVFNAGADGVTTKNSHYPRSELREMDGNEKASWSNTSGTHVFDVREAFTKLPDTKPEVVGVQIHDDKDDVLQIRLEGKNLMVQYHDGKSETVLDPNYQLGTPFDVRIAAANGAVDVLYNGQKKAQLPLSGSGWYWKVGAYVQSNGTKGDGAASTGEVVVYKADVQHSGAETASSRS